MPQTNITRADVARLAGVSVATVSYVVNDGPRPVAPETRARVSKAIEELGYNPSEVARSLKTKKTLTVGLIVSDILNVFHSGVAKSIEEAARAAGYAVILCNSDEDKSQELLYLRMLQSKGVDGIILAPTGGNIEYLQNMLDKGWNLVQVDRRLPRLKADSVTMDNEQGACDAVTHLIAMGHRRIALVGAPSQVTPGYGRLIGYRRALEAAGIPVDSALMFEGDYKAEAGREITSRLFNLDPLPTAIFAANNRLGLGVMKALDERGLSIPSDMALCVFDDLEYYSLLAPKITAVGYSIYDLGQTSFRLLLERMTGERADDTPRHEVLPCQLTIRESSA